MLYFITPPIFSKAQLFEVFGLLNSSKLVPQFICLRNSPSFLYDDFANLCEDVGASSLVNPKNLDFEELNLIIKSKILGVHFKDINTDAGLLSKCKDASLITIKSTHNAKDCNSAINYFDFATISPIYHTEGKGTPLGLEIFKELKDLKKIIALGGINRKKIEVLENLGVVNFASISLFLR